MGAVYVRGEHGAMLTFTEGRMPAGAAERLAAGDLTRVNADGTPWADPTDADVPEPVVADLADAPRPPSVRENRATWQRFAISQGMDREEAAKATKAELVEEFTKLRAVS